jgi:hypothetical protein
MSDLNTGNGSVNWVFEISDEDRSVETRTFKTIV